MTVCPIAVVASCARCPVVSLCPLKSVLGDHVPPTTPPPVEADDAGRPGRNEGRRSKS